MTILRMRLACWVNKATDTHSEYEILIDFFMAKMDPRTGLNVSCYVHWRSSSLTSLFSKIEVFQEISSTKSAFFPIF